MDCVAVEVKTLDAAGGAAFCLGFDGKSVAPVAKKESKIDAIGDNLAHVRAEIEAAVLAVFFDDGVFVAGERHHIAKRWKGLDKGNGFYLEGPDALVNLRVEEGGFAGVEGAGQVAGAEVFGWVVI